MKLGMEIGLDPDHIVLDGDPAPPKKGTAPPICVYLVKRLVGRLKKVCYHITNYESILYVFNLSSNLW